PLQGGGGDTQPPTVSITSPVNGAQVNGLVTVSGTASDNVAVQSVQFQLDGANLGLADTTAPYTTSWDTTKATNGSHNLTAIATDTSGNQTTSGVIQVTITNSGCTGSGTNWSCAAGATADDVNSAIKNASKNAVITFANGNYTWPTNG